jgi:hypothetical protein
MDRGVVPPIDAAALSGSVLSDRFIIKDGGD